MVSATGPKVVRIIARMNVGGPARHVALLHDGLTRRGFDTLLVHGSLDEGEASLEHLAGEQGPTLFIPELGRRVRPYDDVRALWKLLRVIFRERPDIVHTHTAKAGALGRVAAIAFNLTRRRKRRCLVVHTFHGHVLTGYFPAATSRLIGWVERGLALGTDRVITLSPGQRQELVYTLGVAPEARTVVMPLGLNLEPLLNLKSPGQRYELGIGRDDFVIGYVGRFVPIKDLPTLVRAFSQVTRVVPRAWLLLAGDGPARASLESLAVELGVSDRVRCLGWTEDLAAVYATMDLCVLSSLNEGTPVAIIEAMAAGKAVVATAVGGVPDLIEPHATGLLVPPGDTEALGDSICRLAADPGLRRRMGDAGRQRVAARYRHTRLVSDVEALYREGLAEKRG